MLPLNPLQSWVFIILMFTSIVQTVRAMYWRNQYWSAERTRLYLAKLKSYEQNHMDEIYRKSMFKD